MFAMNKENKKQEPNPRVITVIAQADKLDGVLLSFIEPKTERKGFDSRYKKEEEVEKAKGNEQLE